MTHKVESPFFLEHIDAELLLDLEWEDVQDYVLICRGNDGKIRFLTNQTDIFALKGMVNTLKTMTERIGIHK